MRRSSIRPLRTLSFGSQPTQDSDMGAYLAILDRREGPHLPTTFALSPLRFGRFWTVKTIIVSTFNNIREIEAGFDSHRPLQKPR